jgi:hypothetical protein
MEAPNTSNTHVVEEEEEEEEEEDDDDDDGGDDGVGGDGGDGDDGDGAMHSYMHGGTQHIQHTCCMHIHRHVKMHCIASIHANPHQSARP